MKLGKAFLAALILMAFPTVGFGQRQTASKDGNGVRGLLLHDAANLQTRRWLDDGFGGALFSFSPGASNLVDQGISGVSDTDPWNIMIRSGAGTELGLAASPFAIRIFDGASAALFTTSNKGFVDTELETADLDTGGGTDTQAVVGLRIAEDGGSKLVGSADPLPVGGTALADILTQLIVGQTASEPTVIAVGITPTLLFSASATRRAGFMQNAGTASVFLGKAAVTTTTGEIMAGSSVANDGLGGTAIAEHGDTVFGVVAVCCVNVRISEVSD